MQMCAGEQSCLYLLSCKGCVASWLCAPWALSFITSWLAPVRWNCWAGGNGVSTQARSCRGSCEPESY